MKLKIKNLDWQAGRPVAILNAKTAKSLNVSVGERIFFKAGSRSVYSIIDLSPNEVKDGQVGLSRELSSVLKKKTNDYLEISNSTETDGTRLIRKKLAGGRLSEQELRKLISEIVNNDLSEAEIAFFIAASIHSDFHKFL